MKQLIPVQRPILYQDSPQTVPFIKTRLVDPGFEKEFREILAGFRTIDEQRDHQTEARTMTPTDAQLVPIRETISGTIDEWRSTCRIEPDKTHTELEAPLVGAFLAMQQSGLSVVQARETP